MDIFDYMSIAAFLMSAITWFYSWYSNRANVNLKAISYTKLPNNKHLFYLTIENNSKSAIVISRIVLFDASKNCFIGCGVASEEAYTVKHYKGNELAEKEPRMTMGFPVPIPGIGAISGFVQFEDHQQILGGLATAANFQLHTNLDRTFEYSLQPEKRLTIQELK